jgi:hypothetical protein
MSAAVARQPSQRRHRRDGDGRGRHRGLAAVLPRRPATSNLLHFTIPNTPLSALRVLGVHDARTPPWDRPVQAAVGVAAGLVAIYRGRWPAVLLAAVAARLVLDPGTDKYYVAGLVVGAVIWDVVGARTAVPWWTATACLGLFTARWVPMPAPVHGWLTVGYFLECCVLVVRPSARPPGMVRAAPRHG